MPYADTTQRSGNVGKLANLIEFNILLMIVPRSEWHFILEGMRCSNHVRMFEPREPCLPCVILGKEHTLILRIEWASGTLLIRRNGRKVKAIWRLE